MTFRTAALSLAIVATAFLYSIAYSLVGLRTDITMDTSAQLQMNLELIKIRKACK